MSRWFENLGSLAARRRWILIVAYAAISLALLWKSSSIRLETSLTDLLPRGTPSADDFQDLIAAEESVDRLFVSVRVEPEGVDPENDLNAMREAADSLAGSLLTSGLAKSVRFGVDEEEAATLLRLGIEHLPVLVDPARIEEIRERFTPSRIHDAVAMVREHASMPGFTGIVEEAAALDPLGLLPLLRLSGSGAAGMKPDPETGLFLSKDGRQLLVVIEAARPPTEVAFSRKLLDEVHAAEDRIHAERPEGSSLRFDHAGGHLFALEDERRVRHDAATTSALSIAGVGIVYLFVVRRAALWLAILVPLVTSTVWTLGFASIFPGRLNMVTVAFAAILLGIGDDAMLHLYLREREERRRGTRAPASAAAALKAAGPAVVVATLTTAASFFALSFVHFRGLAELGIVAGMGMLSLLAGVLLFFPAALAILAEREQASPRPSLRLPSGLLLRIHDASTGRRFAILGVLAVVTAGMIAAASRVKIATDLGSIRGEDPASKAMERVLAPFGPAYSAETLVVIHGGRAGSSGPVPPDRVQSGLEAAERLAAACRDWTTRGRVITCDSPASLRPPEGTQRRRFETSSRLPWRDALHTLEVEAQAAGMEERFFSPFLQAARRYDDYEAVRIPADEGAFGSLGVPRTTVHIARADQAAAIAGEIRRTLASFPTRIASVALVSGDLSRIIADDFRRAVWLVAAAIAILALAAFRSARLFLLIILPVLLGCVFMLGTLGLAGVELNLMTMMGLPIVFGLGVDYGVYLVDRWSRENETPREALAGVGPSMLVTGLTTLAGFAALLSAELAGLRSIGLAVTLGASYTLAAALFVLPLVLPRRR